MVSVGARRAPSSRLWLFARAARGSACRAQRLWAPWEGEGEPCGRRWRSSAAIAGRRGRERKARGREPASARDERTARERAAEHLCPSRFFSGHVLTCSAHRALWMQPFEDLAAVRVRASSFATPR
eukprot:368534-Prymnesium_polylepis.1